MIEIDGFLEPVAGANPCGENLYYSPVFEKIREARRQDDAGPMGQWERELKASDFRTVIKLSEEALRTKTKDLWLAAWLTEAWIGRDRIPGLTAGLKLLTALMTTFWDGLHPDVEEGDLGLRATPLEWLGSAATAPSPILLLKSVPLTENGVTWLAYKDARAMGYEDAVEAAKWVNVTSVVGVHYDTFPYIKMNHQQAKQAFANEGIMLHLPLIGETIDL